MEHCLSATDDQINKRNEEMGGLHQFDDIDKDL